VVKSLLPETKRLRELCGRAAAISIAIALLAGHASVGAQSGRTAEHWVGTWATSEVGRPQTPPPPVAPAPAPPGPPVAAPAPPAPFMHFNNQTLRQIVHTSIGGNRARVVLTNTFGTTPLTIGAAHIARRDTTSAIVPASDRALTFSGRPTITIPPFAMVYSDPVDLNVPALTDLAIDLYLPGDTNTSSPLTMHNGAFQTNYVSQTGNHAGMAALPVVATTPSWFLVSRVEVMAPETVGAVVTFGDSITDGTRSTPDTNHRWTDYLAARLNTQPGGAQTAVLNAGIAGNRVLSEGAFNVGINALARFERNALDQPGVTHIVVLEGINDIGQARQNPTPTAEDVIAGHKQIIERAHTRGLKVYGATLTPFEGAAYFTKEGEAKRQAVNQWIRTSHAYDAVIDFDVATRDAASPTKFLPQYDSGDHLHPNDAGYQAMANAVDLALFKAAQATQRTARQRQ
jgi:lysophospholipase L1-like esterase